MQFEPDGVDRWEQWPQKPRLVTCEEAGLGLPELRRISSKSRLGGRECAQQRHDTVNGLRKPGVHRTVVLEILVQVEAPAVDLPISADS